VYLGLFSLMDLSLIKEQTGGQPFTGMVELITKVGWFSLATVVALAYRLSMIDMTAWLAATQHKCTLRTMRASHITLWHKKGTGQKNSHFGCGQLLSRTVFFPR